MDRTMRASVGEWRWIPRRSELLVAVVGVLVGLGGLAELRR
jgi:hypothetical protein